MKKQHDIMFVTDWQLNDYSCNEPDNNQETDGIEEDNEYRFYSMAGNDPDFLKLQKGN